MAREDSLFPFKPSKPAALLFTALFAITLIIHVIQATRARVLYMLPLIIGTLFQVAGYGARYVSILNPTSLGPYVASQTGIVVSPALLAAQDYMIVGRMMAYVGPESTLISHLIVTKLFVFIDVVCILTQTAGIGIFSAADDSASSVKLGRAILIAGLVFQIISFGVFMALTAIFDWKSRQLKGKQISVLNPLFIAFYVSSILIIGRSIYRTIEFATINFSGGAQGYLWNNEWPFYVLDSIPVFIATVAFNVAHPAKFLPRVKGLRMDGTVEQPRKHWWSKADESAIRINGNPSEDILMKNRV